MSTHNICFHGEIKKTIYLIPTLIRPMMKYTPKLVFMFISSEQLLLMILVSNTKCIIMFAKSGALDDDDDDDDDLCFKSLSTLFKSYRDHGRMIMKSCAMKQHTVRS